MPDGRDMNGALRRGAALWTDVAVVGVLGGGFILMLVPRMDRLCT